MKEELERYLPLAEAISKLLYPFAEIVIHDLAKEQIVAIFNSFSKRVIGDLSYLDQADWEHKGPASSVSAIIGPYEKINYDGRKLKSISTVIHDNDNKVSGLLCINLDISIFAKYKDILHAFLNYQDSSVIAEHTSPLFRNDLYEQINNFVHNYCLENNLSIDTLDRHEKKALILQLKRAGALKERNATNYIARTLGISRATIYNYLKEE